MVLTQLHRSVGCILHGCGETIRRQQIGKLPCTLNRRRARQVLGIATLGSSDALMCVLGDKMILRLRGHEAQCTKRDVVVHLLEGISTRRRQCVHLGRSTTTTRGGTARAERCFLVGRYVLGRLERIEVPPNRGRREFKIRGKARCTRRTTLKQSAGNPRCSAGDFHNGSVT